MCKATCQNKCGAPIGGCKSKPVTGFDPAMTGAERTAQPAPAVKIPVEQRPVEMEASFDGKKWFKIASITSMEDLGKAIADLPTYPYPHELPEPRTPVSWPQIQGAHEASRRQNAMTEACAIASALASESRESDDPEPLAALMRHVGTQEHATLQLLKLVGRIGLRQWFDGDYVVLSKRVADTIVKQLSVGHASNIHLNEAIERAKQ